MEQHKPIGVLTDSRARYLLFLRESGMTAKQAVHVNDMLSIAGMNLSGVVRVGNWKKHPDHQRLETLAESRVR